MIDCNITTNYFAEKKRMVKLTDTGVCEIKCTNCPLSEKNNGKGRLCVDYELQYPEEVIAIVQKWSDEHPQRTYLTEFIKHYPNALLNDTGLPKGVCLYNLGLMSLTDCKKNRDCVKCWNQPIEESDLVESEKIDIKKNKA